MDVVGVMAVVRVSTAQCTEALPMECQVGVTFLAFHTQCLSRLCSTHTHNGSEYAAITPTTSISTDTIEPLM